MSLERNKKIGKKMKSFIQRIETNFVKGRTIEEFIKSIEGRVNVVIDIRYNQFGKPAFLEENFNNALKANEIEYEYIQELGNPFYKQNRNDPIKARKIYVEYLNKAFFITATKKEILPYKTVYALYRKIAHAKDYKTKTFCLACWCNTINPALCHRFWLKEVLINMMREELGLEKANLIEYWRNYKIPELIYE